MTPRRFARTFVAGQVDLHHRQSRRAYSKDDGNASPECHPESRRFARARHVNELAFQPESTDMAASSKGAE
jgi:hypothetical protein